MELSLFSKCLKKFLWSRCSVGIPSLILFSVLIYSFFDSFRFAKEWTKKDRVQLKLLNNWSILWFAITGKNGLAQYFFIFPLKFRSILSSPNNRDFFCAYYSLIAFEIIWQLIDFIIHSHKPFTCLFNTHLLYISNSRRRFKCAKRMFHYRAAVQQTAPQLHPPHI